MKPWSQLGLTEEKHRETPSHRISKEAVKAAEINCRCPSRPQKLCRSSTDVKMLKLMHPEDKIALPYSEELRKTSLKGLDIRVIVRVSIHSQVLPFKRNRFQSLLGSWLDDARAHWITLEVQGAYASSLISPHWLRYCMTQTKTQSMLLPNRTSAHEPLKKLRSAVCTSTRSPW